VKRLIPFLPISARIRPETSFKQRWEWTVLDTFDSYSARYEFNQRASDVMAALKEAGIDRIQRRPARGMAITGTKSHRPGN